MKTSSWIACVLAAGLVLTGCGRDHDDDEKSGAAGKGSAVVDGAAPLTPAQSKLMGLGVVALVGTTLRDEVQGQAQVLSHEALAQLLADVAGAHSAVQQSSATLQRTLQLAPTAGALGADVLEQAQRQARADALQLQLAQRRLSAQFGGISAALNATQLDAIADGRNKLLHVVLPTAPRSGTSIGLRFVTLDNGGQPGGWRAVSQWPAPVADGVSGLSLYAVVTGGQLTEGSRLVALAETGSVGKAVRVPGAAVVVHDGESWCYVQTGEGQYQRRRVDTLHPQGDGYAVAEGLRVGDSVVVQGAGLLLAREFGQEAGEQ